MINQSINRHRCVLFTHLMRGTLWVLTQQQAHSLVRSIIIIITNVCCITSGSGYPVTTHSRRVWLPSSTVRLSSGCTNSGWTGRLAPALRAAVSTAGTSTSDSWQDVRASPPRFLAMTVYRPQSSLNTSRMSSDVTPALTEICQPQHTHIQCESKKSPLRFSDIFSQTDGNFLISFTHTYYTFLSTLEYKFLFNYLQLWRSYAILSAATQRFFTFH